MIDKKKLRSLGLLAAVALGTAFYIACGDDDGAVKETPVVDGGPSATTSTSGPPTGSSTTPPGNDGGPPGTDGGTPVPPGCVQNPAGTSATDLMNACTDAEYIDKNPSLSKLLADGGLPPLN